MQLNRTDSTRFSKAQGLLSRIVATCITAWMFGTFCSAAELPHVPEPKPLDWRHEETRRFPAVDAQQGVAVDGQFFYTISTHALGKYRKDTGERVGGWEGPKEGPIKHLNAGVVVDGLLYCAQSNYPEQPPVSSVEIWNPKTMKHVNTHSFGRYEGSLTWITRRNKNWIACFAHYAKEGSELGNPSLTQVVEFDDHWRRVGGWIFPEKLIKRFAGRSASGGAFGPGGFLFVTGHDAKELYVLSIPDTGSVLNWENTIPISAEGQSFSWDPTQPNAFYSISRRTKEVIASRIVPVSAKQ
ncbi:MAG: hypothetical protein JWM68_5792 [Verrucomicrobiales bacterium]|nr:hypothetical protein [Verrucomicrobiales bacterium]